MKFININREANGLLRWLQWLHEKFTDEKAKKLQEIVKKFM